MDIIYLRIERVAQPRYFYEEENEHNYYKLVLIKSFVPLEKVVNSFSSSCEISFTYEANLLSKI